MTMNGVLRDPGGPHWEKRGNALWLECPACATAYPASPAMLAANAPRACCPACHHEFGPAAQGRDKGDPR
jgi:hypothetical protein